MSKTPMSFAAAIAAVILLAANSPASTQSKQSQAEITSVKQDHRVIRDGKEGVLITFGARIANRIDQRVRFAAFFLRDTSPLLGKTARHRSPTGQLTSQMLWTPLKDVAVPTGLELFVPYEEFDLPSRGSFDVRFVLEIQDDLAGGKMMAEAGPFHFVFPPAEGSPPRTDPLLGKWSGTEDLKGFGALTFEFEPNGVSFMSDKEGRRQGTWKMDGNDVLLTFFNGVVSYRGTLSGGTMSGTALSGRMSWNWRATREGGAPPVVSPPTAVGIAGRWRGTEDLKGYGDLLFELEPNGTAYMTDKDGRRPGTWKLEGNEATIAFYNGTVVYRGNLSGDALAGTVVSGRMNWNWRATREGSPLPQPPVSPPVIAPPVPPPVAVGLLGHWRGTEELKGYGDLLFEFEANGISYMTDKDGRRQGTWRLQGQEVTIAFYNDTVIYRGVLNGNDLAGSANSGNMSWNWRATREGGAPAPVAPPVARPPVAAPPVAAGILGSWRGSEDLQGYGDLQFEFQPEGVSFMIDKDGRRQGTWSIENNTVTLTFYNGTVVYRGTLTGSEISGTCVTGNRSWNWRVRRSP